jgi:hypothetical protein
MSVHQQNFGVKTAEMTLAHPGAIGPQSTLRLSKYSG